MDFEGFKDKKIAIVWYGREGKSSCDFLIKIGISPQNITILDGAEKIPWTPDFGCESIFGEHYLDTLDRYDIIIKTPGISIYHPKIASVKDKITSQAQIFFDHYQGKVIAVSGTKGKSTTVSLIYEMLQHAGRDTQLIGNIGNPVLDYLDTKNPQSQTNQYAVFELSSYMLEWLTKKNYISVLLNIYADHLDRHQGFENYQDAKLNILKGSQYNLVRDEIMERHNFTSQEVKEEAIRIFGHEGRYRYQDGWFFVDGTKVLDDDKLLLRGEHNRMNICAVLGICDIMQIDYEVLAETLATFKGLPHRMEIIWTYGEIIRVDDAISTTPESTIQAIKTFDHQIDTIFLWGTDRGYVFDDLIKTIKTYGIRNIVLFPDSGKRILEAIKSQDIQNFNILQTDDMKAAVLFAYQHTHPSKICLLSTASPSYSLRKNFEEKGDLFKRYIKEIG